MLLVRWEGECSVAVATDMRRGEARVCVCVLEVKITAYIFVLQLVI